MANHTMSYELIIERFREWALQRSDIRLAMIIGSRARTDRPADEWSDLDVAFVTAHPDAYISTAGWLDNIGFYHLTFLEETSVGNMKERRVLFDGGLDVDFIPVPLAAIQNGWPQEVIGVLHRGYTMILDKDNLKASIPVISDETREISPPSELEFLQLVNDFMYHAVWTAKKLCRGELWTAKFCCDSLMKWQLLKMIEWHSKSVLHHKDTWHNGRFLDHWADPRVVEQLRHAFAKYDASDVWNALLHTTDLFRWLAMETATHLGMPYPARADSYVTSLIQSYKTRCSS